MSFSWTTRLSSIMGMPSTFHSVVCLPESGVVASRNAQYHCPATEMEWEKPFHFTRLGSLPGELRQQIYNTVLVTNRLVEHGGSPVRMVRQRLNHDRPDNGCMVLLLVCRQIYREAYDIYYRNHTPQFCDPRDLSDFLNTTSLHRLHHLRSLCLTFATIKVQTYSAKDWSRILHADVNSRTVQSACKMTTPCLSPQAKESLQYLEHCPNLERIHLDIPMGKTVCFIAWLDLYLSSLSLRIAPCSPYQWSLEATPDLREMLQAPPLDREGFLKWLHRYEPDSLGLAEGTLRRVEVDVSRLNRERFR